MDMLVACPLFMSFMPASSFWQEHTGACMFRSKKMFFISSCLILENVHFIHVFAISMRFVHVTFLSPDWSGKGGSPFPPPFPFLGLESSVWTQHPRCKECLPDTSPYIPQDFTSIWGACASVRYAQISEVPVTYFVLFICACFVM